MQPADTVHAASNSADTAQEVITEKKLKRYKIALDLELRRFFSKQGFTPGAVSYRVRTMWKEILNVSFHKNDITQALTRAVRKDSEISKRVKEEILHILSTSDSESEEDIECAMPASGSQATRVTRAA